METRILSADHLGKDSLVALAVAAGAGEHRDFSGALHPNGAAFKAGAAAGLHESRDAHAHQLAARPRFVSLSDKFFVIGQTQRFGERFLIVARVVFDAYASSVRELLGANEIFAPDRQTVEPNSLAPLCRSTARCSAPTPACRRRDTVR